MRAKICKIFLLLLIFIFLLSLISCKNSQDKAIIADLEEELADCKGQQTTEVKGGEKQEETAETLAEEIGINFTPVIEKDLYVQGQTRFTFVLNNYLYTGGQGLSIFDITDQANPNLVGTINNDWVTGLYVDGDYAYINYSNWDSKTNMSKSGFKVIDVTNKENPTEVADLNMDGNIYNIATLNNYIFISYGIYGQQESETGIKIVDMTDKTNPSFIKNIAVRRYGGGPFCIAGKSGYFLDSGNLKIIDLKDPANANVDENYPLSLSANEIVVNGNYFYFVMANTLQIIDLSDSNLEIIGGVFGRGYTQGIAIEEDYACLSYKVSDSNDENWIIKESGLQIIDLSDKTQPSIVTKIDIPGEAAEVFIKDNYAYVAAGQNGVQIVKLFDE